MKHDAKVHLHDVQEAGELILEFTRGMSLEDYCGSELVKAAVTNAYADRKTSLR